MLWFPRKAFSVSTDMFMGFSLSSLLVQWITGIGFQILNQPCIPRIKCPGFDVRFSLYFDGFGVSALW